MAENTPQNGPIQFWRRTPVRMLQNTKRLGQPVRVAEDEIDNLLAPPIQATDFTFSSVSDAV